MTSKGNRFGIGPVDMPADFAGRRSREPGPMGVAVRESATSAQESSEMLVEQRRQNAVDAKEFRAAREAGRVLVNLMVDQIETEALPRDRLDLVQAASSDEMDELKASIRERGQREPIEVFVSADGRYQLKAGWRRLTALRQLFGETNDVKYATVVARVTALGQDRADLYVDMVEENVIRQDLSFAEMAQIAIQLAADPQANVGSVEEAVGRLFRSLHKVKRAYIRSFVSLLQHLGAELRHPRSVARDLGVDVARKLALADAGSIAALKQRLARAMSEADQTLALRDFLTSKREDAASAGADLATAERPKFEFYVGDCKVTARKGEVRIKSGTDFTAVERSVLERAVRAFQAALSDRS